MKKQYIEPTELLASAFSLGLRIHESGFRPDYLLGIWRGGTPVAAAVHELLYVLGHRPEHFAIKTASYTGIDAQEALVSIEGLNWLLERLRDGQNVLLVDDIFDTGRTFQTLRERIAGNGQKDLDIRIGVAWWKPRRNLTAVAPDYHIHCASDWLVFPHELAGLSLEELRTHKPLLAPLLKRLGELLGAQESTRQDRSEKAQ